MILGGLVRIDVLECEGYETTPEANHIRITPFMNQPVHITNPSRAEEILNTNPAMFYSNKSPIEITTLQPMGPKMAVALDLEVKSKKDPSRNTLEIVFAGVGWVAIGGNFSRAKIRVYTPEGRGVDIRQPVVKTIHGDYSLTTVKGPRKRMIHLGNTAKVAQRIRELKKEEEDREKFNVERNWAERRAQREREMMGASPETNREEVNEWDLWGDEAREVIAEDGEMEKERPQTYAAETPAEMGAEDTRADATQAEEVQSEQKPAIEKHV
jgi:hypothetical protein